MEIKKVMECDIVIVGGGNAGLVAAIEAANQGANVILLEKAPIKLRGGNSRFTGGVWRIAFDNDKKDILPYLDASTLPVPLENIDIEPYSKDEFYSIAVSTDLQEPLKKAGYVDTNKEKQRDISLPEPGSLPNRYSPISP